MNEALHSLFQPAPRASDPDALAREIVERLTYRIGKDPKVAKPEWRDRLPLTPAGEAYKSYEPIERSYDSEPALLEFVPQYWVNPADLGDSVKVTKRTDRLSGCCGEAGTDGPNRICRCGAEIGTYRSDCWTPHVFIPNPGATDWREIF